MNSFLTYKSIEYPDAKNLIPIQAFINLYNQWGTLLQKNVKNSLITNELSINFFFFGIKFEKILNIRGLCYFLRLSFLPFSTFSF
jgi:hypothetical protein